MFFRISPLYIRQLGGSSTDAGLLLAINTFAGLIALTLGGILSHRVKPKNILFLGWLLSAVAAAVYFSLHSLLGVLIGITLEGLSFVEMPPRVYLFSKLSGGRETHRALYIFTGGISLGFIIGPPIGGYLATHMGWQPIFACYFTLALLASIVVWAFTPADIPPAPWQRGKRISMGKILLPVSITGIAAIASSTVAVATPMALKDLAGASEQTIGLLSSLSPIASLTLSPLSAVGLSADTLFLIMILGLTVGSVAMLKPTPITGAIYYFTHGWIDMLYTGGQSITINRVPEDEHAAAAATVSSFTNIGYAIGYILGGFLYQQNPRYPFLFAAAVGIIIILLINILQRQTFNP